MSLLKKITDSLSDEANLIAGKIDLTKSAEEIALTLENENVICFNVIEKHDQEIREN